MGPMVSPAMLGFGFGFCQVWVWGPQRFGGGPPNPKGLGGGAWKLHFPNTPKIIENLQLFHFFARGASRRKITVDHCKLLCYPKPTQRFGFGFGVPKGLGGPPQTPKVWGGPPPNPNPNLVFEFGAAAQRLSNHT